MKGVATHRDHERRVRGFRPAGVPEGFQACAKVARSRRVTVTLSAVLVEGIDRIERNRSRFIAEAVERELARRRRDALLQSIGRPHPETTGLADAGLTDWTSDLPDDEGLVDSRGGIAVRWIEGQGWVREPPA